MTNINMRNFLVVAFTPVLVVMPLFWFFDSHLSIEGIYGIAIKGGGAIAAYLIVFYSFDKAFGGLINIIYQADFFEDLVGTWSINSRTEDGAEGLGTQVITFENNCLTISGNFKIGDKPTMDIKNTFFAVNGAKASYWYELEDNGQEYQGFVWLTVDRREPHKKHIIEIMNGSWIAYSKNTAKRVKGTIILQRQP
ncbi:hypothetical protein BCS42_01390 [Crenothrix sp. D3]|nr:hypothetical protein BCS42_01390 [Crenothrix sp. D3]